MTTVILFNKPYGVHSQFRKDHDHMATLADFFSDKTLRVAGRLDKDSEGLLILTDNSTLNHTITTPAKGQKTFGKTYLVQVEHTPTTAQIHALQTGVTLKDGKTLPAQVSVLDENDLPIALWERNPPIRQRQSISTAWLSITIYEGKNRQVRRMTAHVGLPCLRLIRHQIGAWTLGDLGVGECRKLTLTTQEFNKLTANTQTKPKKKPFKSFYNKDKS